MKNMKDNYSPKGFHPPPQGRGERFFAPTNTILSILFIVIAYLLTTEYTKYTEFVNSKGVQLQGSFIYRE
jgi:hypothetical protein